MRKIIHTIMWLFTPDFWRRLITGRVRVAVYLSGGSVVKFNVENATVVPGERFKFDNMRDAVTFKVEDVIGFREVRWF